ncbi:hypothetical protein FNB79_09715 [Formosa sediminum]|uniref:Uncharacterized protein n=1 Tax=Formosa sediminum TaxID=2594004 RepID=A0A516GRU1_9FLAO|nr:hypothetical protein [Formosa sediminum]QDO94235.1 hypothetical protein FNB79_09715 [Formosa sediminum]
MRIKNKHTGQIIGGTYSYWKKEILPKHKETNYDILTHPDIVDVYEINPNNGKLNFIESIDRSHAKKLYLTKDNFTIKDSDLSKFDEYYRLKNQSDFSFLQRLLKRIKQIIKPSKNPNVIPFNRFERITIIIGISAIAIAIIIPIVLFIIDKVYF